MLIIPDPTIGVRVEVKTDEDCTKNVMTAPIIIAKYLKKTLIQMSYFSYNIYVTNPVSQGK